MTEPILDTGRRILELGGALLLPAQLPALPPAYTDLLRDPADSLAETWREALPGPAREVPDDSGRAPAVRATTGRVRHSPDAPPPSPRAASASAPNTFAFPTPQSSRALPEPVATAEAAPAELPPRAAPPISLVSAAPRGPSEDAPEPTPLLSKGPGVRGVMEGLTPSEAHEAQPYAVLSAADLGSGPTPLPSGSSPGAVALELPGAEEAYAKAGGTGLREVLTESEATPAGAAATEPEPEGVTIFSQTPAGLFRALEKLSAKGISPDIVTVVSTQGPVAGVPASGDDSPGSGVWGGRPERAPSAAQTPEAPRVEDVLEELYERLRLEFLRTYGTTGG